MQKRLAFLAVLVLLLAACSGGTQPSNGTWDSSKWDSAIWQ
jgi:outer membrane biogenesis lipoprotein LolB